jgi:hypothetical protein
MYAPKVVLELRCQKCGKTAERMRAFSSQIAGGAFILAKLVKSEEASSKKISYATRAGRERFNGMLN